MNANRRILLYGNSVIPESIGASLQRFSDSELTTLTDRLEKAKIL